MKLKIAIRLTRWLLNRSDLSIQDRNLLTTCVLDKLAALPLRDMITHNEEGNLLVSGRSLTPDAASKLRQSAKVARESFAFNFVREQVTYVAVTYGVNQAETSEKMLFGKAAIWCMQQLDNWLDLLAKDGTNGNLTP